MTIRPLTDSHKIKKAYRQMTQRLRAGTQAFKRKIGFRGGDVEGKVYWHGDRQFWRHFDLAENRYWCCYGIENPEQQDRLSITVEINSPYKGVNRRIGGVFVTDDKDRVYIAHSGKVGGGRSGIGKEAFWKFYSGEQVETVQWPDGKESPVIVIGRVDSEDLQTDIAKFVHKVAEFKNGPSRNQ